MSSFGIYHMSFCLLFISLEICSVYSTWQDNTKPKRYLHLGEEDMMRFSGNQTNDDHFLLTLPHGQYMLVGSRNFIYNISLVTLAPKTHIGWHPEEKQLQTCYIKGVSNELCQNYIRVMALKDEDKQEFLICGTNAFSPLCKEFKLTNGALEVQKSFNGKGLCPYDPSLNTTAIFADKQLYVATVSDFSGVVPLIYREPLRTEQYDLFTLNQPDFVSSFALGDFVYFFFREAAAEYLNCGKTVYSRVARVCRHDRGGPHKFKNKWTSFLKSRLNCSVSGDYPFYFNEIKATTEPIEGRYGGHATTLLYGVFTTQENSIPGSAVCAFTFQDIMDTFEGSFKGKESINSNWLPVKHNKVPEPRPGQCVKDSSTLPDVTLNFIKTHPLMDEAVPAFFGQPVLIRTSYHSHGRFTAITVDRQVRTTDAKHYDVLFIGTDDGKILKAVNARSADSYSEVSPVVIEELSVFGSSTVIQSLRIVTAEHRKKLIAVTSKDVVSIPLHRCASRKINSCRECVGLQDPYCGWDRYSQKCRPIVQGKELLQSVSTGVHVNCSGEIPSHAPSSFDRDHGGSFDPGRGRDSAPADAKYPPPRNPTTHGGSGVDSPMSASVPVQFTAETLSIAVASAGIGALIIGFIGGFFCGRRCHKDEDNQLYAVTDYEYYDQRQSANSRLTGDMQEEVTYAEPVLVPQALNKPSVNLLLNMSPKATLKNTPAGMLAGMNATQPPMGFNLGMPTPSGAMNQPGPPDMQLPFVPPESYSTHGTLRSSEKYGTRGREPKREFDPRALHDGYSTTRSVKKVYL